jgi:hypothetical protein
LWIAGAGLVAACVLLAVLAMFLRPPALLPPAGPVAPPSEPVPLAGELIVKVWSPPGQGVKRGLRVQELGALPVRRGEQVHLVVRLNQPAYCYLMWLDGQGHVDPLYPWARDFRIPPAGVSPRESLDSPPELDRGWPMQGPSGLETALLLVRRTPVPAETKLADLIGVPPPAPLRDELELAVRGFDPGQPTAALQRGTNRGLAKEAEQIDEPLLQLLERLRPHFELIRAVRFAYKAG